MRPEFIILAVFFTIFIGGFLIGTYNKFIKYQNRIEEAWSSIDVALKRRFNLIPNLVSVIKGYSEHESETTKEFSKNSRVLMVGSLPRTQIRVTVCFMLQQVSVRQRKQIKRV